MAGKVREYHFSAGNSNRGPVGFCATVKARSKAEAVEILSSAMPCEYETGIEDNDGEGRIVYFTFYLNSAAVKASQIDYIEDVDKWDEGSHV